MTRIESAGKVNEISTALQDCGTDATNLRQLLEVQAQLHEQWFASGTPAAKLIAARAELIDALLRHLWHCFGFDQQQACALIAVGGYGRAELHPWSDIDLLILYDEHASPPPANMEAFVALLWDLKLNPGHSVRTVAECTIAARDDLTVMTNLLDSRLLVGEAMLVVQLQKALSPMLMWPPDAFFRGKLEEQYARHRKFEGTAYKLEPNLKSSPGGLRDIQNIYWVAKRRFGDSSLPAFTRRGLLSLSEYRALTRCLNFLWKVRYALHLAAGRAEDRLLFDLQISVAERLGYIDTKEKRGVEQFMKQYFRCILTVRNLNELLLQLFDEVLIGRHGEIAATKLDAHFQHRQGHIEITQPDTFTEFPEALLLIFVHIAEQTALTGITAPTLRLLRENRHHIDKNYRATPRHQQLFIRLLRARGNLALALFLMKDTGVLGALVPAFAAITGQMQFDRFHHYTVDEHTLFLLRNLVRLAEPQHAGLFAHAERIMQRQVAPEIIYLAGLFHDIGKGRGGDHAELGAIEALHFCSEIGCSDDDAELVSWLVAKHLAMSHTAQRKDINDGDVIAEFAQLVGSQQKLELLYVLTMCDIRATNASLWNSWKDALLRDLYLATSEYMRRGVAVLPADIAARVREDALQELLAKGFASNDIHDLWRTLGADYFNKNSADQLVWITQILLQQPDSDEPLVVMRQNAQMGGTELMVFIEDQDALFAAITALLAQKKVSIQAATIHTTPYGMGLDSFIVLEENGAPINDIARMQGIQRYLAQHLHDSAKTALNLQHVSTRRLPFELPTQISFHSEVRKQRTAIQIITLDRPGLLARVGAAFKYCGVVLHSAKIVTLGERAEDVFFVTNHEQQALSGEQQQQLEQWLRTFIDKPAVEAISDGKSKTAHTKSKKGK